MTAMRSWAYTILFLIWALIGPILVVPFLVTRRMALRGIRIWVYGVMILARTVAGIKFKSEGRENIPTGACIIAGQHQSNYETYRMFIEVDDPVFVLKRELIWIPIIGWFILRAGLIPIDRSTKASALRRMMRAADEAVARGAQIVIFPEGTRISPGERGEYKSGIVALYKRCGVPVVPMALNSGYFWGKKRVRKDAGEIVFQYLPAVEPGLGKDQLLSTLRERIEGAAATLPKLDP
jgi:1-acyl-sn-glycerol-3-phosphate acyltransferase